VRMPRIKRRKAVNSKRRGFYLLPSLFTVANMFCGFLSIVESSRGHFERASILILIAIFADILDGRIARLTGTVSQFGEEFDSLADVTSFGVAPALLAYQWGLWEVPRVGMAVAFLFLVAGSIRLARFSSQHPESLDFIGLPIPAGAGSISMLVLTSPTPVTQPWFIPVVVAFVLSLSLLMVSNLPYTSGKQLDLRRKWPAPALFLIALVFSLITLTPHFLSVFAAFYVLSAPVKVLTGKIRRRPSTVESPRPSTGGETDAIDSSDR
jgi:CDP-diacylglycerol--serine O-phosphatidyltransferase